MSTKSIKWENVKVRKPIADKLRSQKRKTGISLSSFTEKAIVEKMTSDGFLSLFKEEMGLTNVSAITYSRSTLKWRVSYVVGNTDEFETFNSMYEYFKIEDMSNDK